jgi:spore maturation protein A
MSGAAVLNAIWVFLVVVAVVVGAATGRLDAVSRAAFDSARTAVEVAFGLVGVMTLWLGVMRVAEAAGLVSMLSRALRPFSRWLFPDVPADHPALGAMLLNISASWLGLGNAATPLGLKAMEELQSLNPRKDTATNAMVTFLAINTTSITLVPATIIAIRMTLGSAQPLAIVAPTVLASCCATVVAIVVARLAARVWTVSGGPTADTPSAHDTGEQETHR